MLWRVYWQYLSPSWLSHYDIVLFQQCDPCFISFTQQKLSSNDIFWNNPAVVPCGLCDPTPLWHLFDPFFFKPSRLCIFIKIFLTMWHTFASFHVFASIFLFRFISIWGQMDLTVPSMYICSVFLLFQDAVCLCAKSTANGCTTSASSKNEAYSDVNQSETHTWSIVQCDLDFVTHFLYVFLYRLFEFLRQVRVCLSIFEYKQFEFDPRILST